MPKKAEELRSEQARIRDTQRKRLERIHSLLHSYQVCRMEEDMTDMTIPKDDVIDEIHEIVHAFLRDFDRAVLIHKVLAQLEGRDPDTVSGALPKENSPY